MVHEGCQDWRRLRRQQCSDLSARHCLPGCLSRSRRTKLGRQTAQSAVSKQQQRVHVTALHTHMTPLVSRVSRHTLTCQCTLLTRPDLLLWRQTTTQRMREMAKVPAEAGARTTQRIPVPLAVAIPRRICARQRHRRATARPASQRRISPRVRRGVIRRLAAARSISTPRTAAASSIAPPRARLARRKLAVAAAHTSGSMVALCRVISR